MQLALLLHVQKLKSYSCLKVEDCFCPLHMAQAEVLESFSYHTVINWGFLYNIKTASMV
jgi:hypothetical protein